MQAASAFTATTVSRDTAWKCEPTKAQLHSMAPFLLLMHLRTPWVSGTSTLTLRRQVVQEANYGLWIIGIISAAALAASAILAFLEFFVSVTGNAGRHTAGLSFPMGYAPALVGNQT